MTSLRDLFTRAARRLAQLGAVAAYLAVVGVVAFVGSMVVDRPLNGCHPQLLLQFGSSAACAAEERALDLSLLIDTGFAVVYGAGLGVYAHRTKAHSRLDPRLRWLDHLAYGGLAAGVLDCVENALLSGLTEKRGGEFVVVGAGAEAAVTAVAVMKWTLLASALWVLLLRVANRRWPRPATDAMEGAPARPLAPDRDVAVCCSGGGIRSAAFSLGVLHALDEEGLSDRVDTVAAVSGGNYAATAWRLEQLGDAPNTPREKAAHRVILRLLQREKCPLESPERSLLKLDSEERPERSSAAHGYHRYLLNGRGGLPRAVGWVVLAIVGNVAQLLVVLEVIGWPIGQLIVAEPFHPELLADGSTLDVELEHVLPLAGLAGLAAVLVVVSPFLGNGRLQRALLAAAAVLLSGAVAFGVLITAVPWLIAQTSGKGTPIAISGAALAVGGALTRMFAAPLRRIAPRLGGFALAVLLLLGVGVVIQQSVEGASPLGSQWVWLGCVVALALLTYGIDTQTWSLREMYRNRLANSFVAEKQRPGSLRARRRGDKGALGVTWAQLADDGLPELIVCSAASRVGLQPNGTPAESFTITPFSVQQHHADGCTEVATRDYAKTLRSWALGPLQSPAGWMATSGAAFASAMGRMGMGSTNALLAALNIDLGVWLPAPARVALTENGDEPKEPLQGARVRTSFPSVGLGRLVNEIGGLYSDEDDMVFVTDGGHVENLGLVELLRRKATRIVCIDAALDEPGSFSTLRDALRHVDAVLPDGERLGFDLAELDACRPPPRTSAFRIPIRRWATGEPGERIGIIYYAKLQAADDQARNLRQFARVDPRFPNYSTANQLLTDQQFVFLLLAGQTAGRRLCEMLRQDAQARRPWWRRAAARGRSSRST